MVFLLSLGFFERRADILAFKLALEAGAAGFTPTIGFFTGDFDARAWGLATGFAGAGLTILARAGLATAIGLATAAGLATIAGLAATAVLTADTGLATATWATFYGAAAAGLATGALTYATGLATAFTGCGYVRTTAGGYWTWVPTNPLSEGAASWSSKLIFSWDVRASKLEIPEWTLSNF